MGLTLVTGASGFVGTHLFQEMRKRGLPVRGVSRQKRPGLVTIPSYGPEVDWTAYLADVDVVVHLAARVHVMREMAKDPLSEFRKANVEATLNLARQAARAGVRRFIFVSTIKVNGESTEPGKPFTADDPPNPQDPYALSKAEAEAALNELGKRSGMDIVVIRPPLIYGPGVGGNFENLMRWAIVGLPSIFPNVQNSRSLIYVANFCDFVITALAHPMLLNRHFLVDDGESLSTHELLAILSRAARKRMITIPVPLPLLSAVVRPFQKRGHINRLLENLELDAAAAYEQLGWEPIIPQLEGLTETIRAFQLNSSSLP